MKQPLIPIVPSAVAGGPGAAGSGERNRGWPLLRLGFRPFYLGAASFGALAIVYLTPTSITTTEIDETVEMAQ